MLILKKKKILGADTRYIPINMLIATNKQYPLWTVP